MNFYQCHHLNNGFKTRIATQVQDSENDDEIHRYSLEVFFQTSDLTVHRNNQTESI